MNNSEIKQLIEMAYDRCDTISQFKADVLKLIDLCEVTVKRVDAPDITNPICTGQIKKQILPLKEELEGIRYGETILPSDEQLNEYYNFGDI